jgi:membrane-associated phospholipid phosphatase
MKAFSNSPFVILPAIPLGLFISSKISDNKEQYNNSIEIAGSILISGGVSFLIKEIVQRNRPFKDHIFFENLVDEKGYSFPSSHAATSFSLATSISILYPK